MHFIREGTYVPMHYAYLVANFYYNIITALSSPQSVDTVKGVRVNKLILVLGSRYIKMCTYIYNIYIGRYIKYA